MRSSDDFASFLTILVIGELVNVCSVLWKFGYQEKSSSVQKRRPCVLTVINIWRQFFSSTLEVPLKNTSQLRIASGHRVVITYKQVIRNTLKWLQNWGGLTQSSMRSFERILSICQCSQCSAEALLQSLLSISKARLWEECLFCLGFPFRTLLPTLHNQRSATYPWQLGERIERSSQRVKHLSVGKESRNQQSGNPAKSLVWHARKLECCPH